MKRRFGALIAAGLVALVAGVAPAVANVPTGYSTSDALASRVDLQLEMIDREMASTDRNLEQVRQLSDQARQRMMVRGRAYYRLTRAGLLPLSSGFESLIEHTVKVERLRRSLAKDLEDSKQLAKLRVDLLQRRQGLLDRKTPLEVQQRAMVEARAALLEAEDRKLAFARAFSSSVGSDYTAVYGGTASGLGAIGPDDQLSRSGGFRAWMGRLPFPLAGRAEIRVVNRPGAGGPALEMQAPRGTPVRAVYAGRVAFADDYSNYGKVVILDHGDSYFTVSGNLESVDVRVGDDVGAGGRVGAIGPGETGGMLYFEIRHGADTVDPGPWMGL